MRFGTNYSDIVPYTSVFIDCAFSDLLYGIERCIHSQAGRNHAENREHIQNEISTLFTAISNPNLALVTLSVRSAFDLFLTAKEYPKGSEIIFTGINIPDMSFIARQHGLFVIPCDIELESLGPNPPELRNLISDRTVAVVVAHLFGRWMDIEPIVEVAEELGIDLIEDCAESFCGFDHLGHPHSAICLFSFGSIKYYTAFGGGVAKIRDKDLFYKMRSILRSQPIQPTSVYLWKLVRTTGIFVCLDAPWFIKPGMFVTDRLNIDHKRVVVDGLRGFPSDLMARLRHQPPTALMEVLLRRLQSFDMVDFQQSAIKGRYVWDRLPSKVLKFGAASLRSNFWLFPILVSDPKKVAMELNRMGIDAYIGASQLSTVLPEFLELPVSAKGRMEKIYLSPNPLMANFFMDHVVYLPVNKTVPFEYLDRIIKSLEEVMRDVPALTLPKSTDLAERDSQQPLTAKL